MSLSTLRLEAVVLVKVVRGLLFVDRVDDG